MATKKKETPVKETGDIVLDKFAGAKRYLGRDLKIITDLFKLEPAMVVKNVGVSFKRPHYMHFEHCHYFRTYDSKGKKMMRSNVVAGHYHELEIYVREDGSFGAECSPPLQNKLSEKITPREKDNHCHDIKYIKSEEIEVVKMKPEAIADFNKGMNPGIDTTLHGTTEVSR